MSVASNLKSIREHIPSGVELICVSKFHPNEMILEAYETGERVFGESKVQELTAKFESLPKDIQWHFIGHLQTNKIKYIASFVHLVHAVDSLKLLMAINKEAEKNNRVIDCLLQVHIAIEETKFGFSTKELMELLFQGEWADLKNIRIRGLMGMATFTDDVEQVRSEMHGLKQIFDRVKLDFFNDEDSFDTLSMGMSEDYIIAIEEGSNMVRVGSSIFGVREY